MRKTAVIVGLSALVMLGGCTSRPISKTWQHTKRVYNTTKKVYSATKAVAEVLNPLEYIYISEHGECVTPEGELFRIEDAIVDATVDQAE